MKHSMKLYKEPFEKIASGKKTVEMRLMPKTVEPGYENNF